MARNYWVEFQKEHKNMYTRAQMSAAYKKHMKEWETKSSKQMASPKRGRPATKRSVSRSRSVSRTPPRNVLGQFVASPKRGRPAIRRSRSTSRSRSVSRTPPRNALGQFVSSPRRGRPAIRRSRSGSRSVSRTPPRNKLGQFKSTRRAQ